jgi:glycolate oxidase iron-sulfur subunit
MPGDLPIIVNSAGCGSTMKEYRHLLPESEPAANFGSRVMDVSEFLIQNGLVAALANAPGFIKRVTYHDACHLSHGQRIVSQPRELLAAVPGIDLAQMAEADMCCGSAGIYNVLQPKMARTLLERKFSNISATEASIVATGNPGCHAWIAQAAREHGRNVAVLHTMEVLESAFSGLEPFLD